MKVKEEEKEICDSKDKDPAVGKEGKRPLKMLMRG